MEGINKDGEDKNKKEYLLKNNQRLEYENRFAVNFLAENNGQIILDWGPLIISGVNDNAKKLEDLMHKGSGGHSGGSLYWAYVGLMESAKKMGYQIIEKDVSKDGERKTVIFQRVSSNGFSLN